LSPSRAFPRRHPNSYSAPGFASTVPQPAGGAAAPLAGAHPRSRRGSSAAPDCAERQAAFVRQLSANEGGGCDPARAVPPHASSAPCAPASPPPSRSTRASPHWRLRPNPSRPPQPPARTADLLLCSQAHATWWRWLRRRPAAVVERALRSGFASGRHAALEREGAASLA